MNIKAIAATALVSVSALLGSVPAEARTPWIYVTEGEIRGRIFVKDITRVGNNIRTYTDSDNEKIKTNCTTGESWWLASNKQWISVGYYKPGSVGQAEYDVVCRGKRPQIG